MLIVVATSDPKLWFLNHVSDLYTFNQGQFATRSQEFTEAVTPKYDHFILCLSLADWNQNAPLNIGEDPPLLQNAELALARASTWLACEHRKEHVEMCSSLWAKPNSRLGEVDSEMRNLEIPNSYSYNWKSVNLCCKFLKKDCRRCQFRWIREEFRWSIKPAYWMAVEHTISLILPSLPNMLLD